MLGLELGQELGARAGIGATTGTIGWDEGPRVGATAWVGLEPKEHCTTTFYTTALLISCPTKTSEGIS